MAWLSGHTFFILFNYVYKTNYFIIQTFPVTCPTMPLNKKPLELNGDFKYALDVLGKTDKSLFITGRAGTGKATRPVTTDIMQWRQFVMNLESYEPQCVEEVLLRHGAQSVTLTDAADDPVLEPAPGETPLWRDTRITALFDAGIEVHCLRDLTRGGLTSALVEIAESTQLQVHLKGSDIPVNAVATAV